MRLIYSLNPSNLQIPRKSWLALAFVQLEMTAEDMAADDSLRGLLAVACLASIRKNAAA